MVIYLNLIGALYLYVLIVYYTSGVIYLKWLLFHRLYPVTVRNLSEDMIYKDLLFLSSMQRVGPDLNILP